MSYDFFLCEEKLKWWVKQACGHVNNWKKTNAMHLDFVASGESNPCPIWMERVSVWNAPFQLIRGVWWFAHGALTAKSMQTEAKWIYTRSGNEIQTNSTCSSAFIILMNFFPQKLTKIIWIEPTFNTHH